MMKEGQLYTQFIYDINRDGVDEVIALRAYNIQGEEHLGQLIVTTMGGSVIWEGPRPSEGNDPVAFGHFHYGNTSLQAIVVSTDETGNEHTDLIVALPVSDLRPTPFRIWRWMGDKFVPKFERTLIEEPADSNYYVWNDRNYEYDQDRWIAKFWYDDDGELLGQIIDTTTPGSIFSGKAKLIPTETGYGIAEWLELPN